MLLSKKYRFLFIHIYRTGGTSISEALQPFLQENDPNHLGRIATYKNKMLPGGQHARLAEIERYYNLKGVFKFAFVRNPWDWILSQYTRANNEPAITENTPLGRAQGYSFEDFIKSGVFQELFPHCQHNWLRDMQYEISMSFIGRYETLEEDFKELMIQFGIDVKLPHLNAYIHPPYKEIYDSKMINLVGDFYRQDVELFGYAF